MSIDYLDNSMELKYFDKRLLDYEFAPSTNGSAGYDLRACIKKPYRLQPGEKLVVKTGLALHMKNPGIAAQILPRSGAGTRGLVLANGTGLIDSDYQKEIIVVLLNRTIDYVFTIEPMERIAQMIFVKVLQPVFNVIDMDFTEQTTRDGFGSTGR